MVQRGRSPGSAEIRRGVPRAREIKSQEAQLESVHRHGTRKDIKLEMEEKTGRR